MTLSHHQAALFTARRLELCDLVQDTLLYLHPDSRVHSHLSPLAYQVICFFKGFCLFVSLLTRLCLFMPGFEFFSDALRSICLVYWRSTLCARPISSLWPGPGGPTLSLRPSWFQLHWFMLNPTSHEQYLTAQLIYQIYVEESVIFRLRQYEEF